MAFSPDVQPVRKNHDIFNNIILNYILIDFIFNGV